MPDAGFFLVGLPAVLLYGISKGGFGGSVAIIGVPLMAMQMSPTHAAAVLLPILVAIDIMVVRTYWGIFDKHSLKFLLPGALVGIAAGYLAAGSFDDAWMRILVGAISLLFGVQGLLPGGGEVAKPHNTKSAGVFGTLAGFTSFSIHAGGPPFQMYMVPRRLDPVVYAGTAALFFAAVNFVKLFPYYALGQLSTPNLTQSLLLLPAAPIGVFIGHWLVRHSQPPLYYGVINAALVLVGGRLLWVGITGL